jgi:hypothetical protein
VFSAFLIAVSGQYARRTQRFSLPQSSPVKLLVSLLRLIQIIEIRGGVKVYPFSIKQQTPYGVERCNYEGVMAECARDWEEVLPSTGSIHALEPDKPVGYALIPNKEKCSGKNAQVIFSTGSKRFYLSFGRRYVSRERHTIDASD